MYLKPATLRGLLVCAGLLIIYVAFEFAFPTLFGKRKLLDFDAFYLASTMMREGLLFEAYDIPVFVNRQAILPGYSGTQLLWSYPPTYGLIIGPLSFMPAWLGYILFMTITLTFFLWVIRQLDPAALSATTMIFFPICTMVIRSGQNSFLLAALMGLSCLLIMRGSRIAGIPLGVMAVKPHLAIGFGIWLLLARRWRPAVLSLVTVAIFCGVSLLLLGAETWRSFLSGTVATGEAFQNFSFSIFRMSSVYAFILSLGFDSNTAMLLHLLVVAGVLLKLLSLTLQGLATRDAMGLAIIFSALLSPYSYDYDLLILAVASTLLFDTARRHAADWQKQLIVIAGWSVGFYGILASTVIDNTSITKGTPPAVIGLVLIAMTMVVLAIVNNSLKASKGVKTTK